MASVVELERRAVEARRRCLKAICKAKSGHPGGSLSCIEILLSIYSVKRPGDKVVLCKGHAAPALYSVLSLEGVISESELDTLRGIESRLQGHQELVCPGIDAGYGSLGHGLSIANGLALGARLKGEGRVFAVLGDGECNEGEVWEAASTAFHYKLDNVTAFVDLNGFQLDGKTSLIKDMRIAESFAGFGWKVVKVDGHDFNAILAAVAEPHEGVPLVIVCNTVKGRGVSVFEVNASLHSAGVKEEHLANALEELSYA